MRLEPVAGVDAGHERALRQVVGVRADLVLEEPVDIREVAMEQILTGAAITGSPGLQQPEIGIHRRPS